MVDPLYSMRRYPAARGFSCHAPLEFQIDQCSFKKRQTQSVLDPMGDSQNIEEQAGVDTSQTPDRPMPSCIAEIGSRGLK